MCICRGRIRQSCSCHAKPTASRVSGTHVNGPAVNRPAHPTASSGAMPVESSVTQHPTYGWEQRAELDRYLRHRLDLHAARLGNQAPWLKQSTHMFPAKWVQALIERLNLHQARLRRPEPHMQWLASAKIARATSSGGHWKERIYPH